MHSKIQKEPTTWQPDARAGTPVRYRRSPWTLKTLSWYDRGRPRLEIKECLPSLVRALADSDSRVRELTAQAVGATGASGVSAVPALIVLLGSLSDGDRNTACIGLAGIGPAANEALPALKKALFDPNADVRRFAKRAIERIER